MRLRNFDPMKLRSVPQKLGLAFLIFTPVLISGIIKINRTPPVLPAVSYYMPNDVHHETGKVWVSKLYDSIHLQELGLQKKVLDLAMKGFSRLMVKGRLNKDSILTIVDFSQSSREKRMYVIDLKNIELLYNIRVAHGRNSGSEFARSFSNIAASHKSSLGFFVTQCTYRGGNGYSLRLLGIEKNINDRALKRNIVIHGADYVDENFLLEKGMLGRSYGCPAIPTQNHKAIIDAIKEGSCLFIYSPSPKYLNASTILNG